MARVLGELSAPRNLLDPLTLREGSGRKGTGELTANIVAPQTLQSFSLVVLSFFAGELHMSLGTPPTRRLRTVGGIVAFHPDPSGLLRLVATTAPDVTRVVSLRVTTLGAEWGQKQLELLHELSHFDSG